MIEKSKFRSNGLLLVEQGRGLSEHLLRRGHSHYRPSFCKVFVPMLLTLCNVFAQDQSVSLFQHLV